MPAKYIQLLKGTGDKKFKAIFYDAARKKIKSVSFGAKGYDDYTTHGDIQRKLNYIQRHSAREDFNNPMTAGALSRWILWDKTTLSASYTAYRNKFGFALY